MVINNRHESLRQRAAKLAAAALALKRHSTARAPFSLAFLSDRQRVFHPELIARVLPAGAAFIYRDYDDPGRAAKAKALAPICRRRGVLFVVAGDVGLAKTCAADGVHIPRWMDGVQNPPGMITTAACHNAMELERAKASGVDAAFLSPVFATTSHPDAATLGSREFLRLANGAGLPVLALGGVDETNAAQLAGPSVVGFGAISAFSSNGQAD